MDNKEQLKTISKIAASFINQSVINEEFKIRFQEKICRTEIEEKSKKYNQLSLGIAISLVVIVSILIIIQNQLQIFNVPYIIPLLLIPVILVLITIGVLEFILNRKYGQRALIEKLGTKESIEKELVDFKKEEGGNYLIVKEAYEAAKTIETESQFPGFLLRILVNISPIKEKTVTKNDIFKFLFYISLGKEKLVLTALAEKENYDIFSRELKVHLENYKLFLEQIAAITKIPRYHLVRAERITTRLNEFSFRKVVQIDNSKNFEALRVILKLLDTDISWVIVGSTNLALQNVAVKAKDIDILTSKDDIFKIQNLLMRYIREEVKYSETDKYRSWYGKFEIKEIKVELMAELEYKTPENIWIKSQSLERKVFFEYDSFKVPVLPIEYEKEFYLIMKRENDDYKIKKIDEFLLEEKK